MADKSVKTECAHCGASMYENDAYVVLTDLLCTTGTRRSYVTENWCEACFADDSRSSPDYPYSVSADFADARLHYWESDGDWHMDPYEDEEDSDSWEHMLHDYGTNVVSIHGWPDTTPQDSLCFGVELEMEAKSRDYFSDMVELLGGMDGNGRYILKQDGSLDDGKGAELVTLPYTLDGHRKVFDWQRTLTPGLRNLARSGRGTENCGIHIHVNKAALSALTIGKLLVFLNSEDNDSFVTLIAQRESSHPCGRDASKKITDVHPGPFADRYDILNVTGYHTVEFRMFRGNLRPERVLKNIEFCHALIRFCERTSIQDATDRMLFMAHLERNAKQYPHLCAYLIEKGYMNKPHARSTAPYAIMAAATHVDA